MNEDHKDKLDEQQNPDMENQDMAEELESMNEARLHSKGENDETVATEEPEEEKWKRDAEEANSKYLRLYAEFDNYKRRTSKERVELLQTAGKDVIVDLLPVLDDFDRTLKALDQSDADSLKEGVLLVSQKLKSMLTKKGLKPMEAIGEDFDPELHEAITRIPAPEPGLAGKIIDEVEKGYYLNDKVLRYAKVVVGS